MIPGQKRASFDLLQEKGVGGGHLQIQVFKRGCGMERVFGVLLNDGYVVQSMQRTLLLFLLRFDYG